jgi:hypothetical protein
VLVSAVYPNRSCITSDDNLVTRGITRVFSRDERPVAAVAASFIGAQHPSDEWDELAIKVRKRSNSCRHGNHDSAHAPRDQRPQRSCHRLFLLERRTPGDRRHVVAPADLSWPQRVVHAPRTLTRRPRSQFLSSSDTLFLMRRTVSEDSRLEGQDRK